MGSRWVVQSVDVIQDMPSIPDREFCPILIHHSLEKLLLDIKALHKPEGFPDDEKSGKDPREYRIFPSKDVLTNSVMKILNNNYDLWTHAVCLGKKGWKLITNNGEPVKGLARPRDSMEAQPIPYEPVQAAEDFKYTGENFSIKVEKGKWVGGGQERKRKPVRASQRETRWSAGRRS